ncbi:unnamed protein product [Mytilus coruscus]|uniref:Uncharacterized protein n=1 Tax=Mytilus coruscus TaxID=42192 RepID=A0A6J8ECK4_MYTCO|nr:unnamed protein product [Mytilus coruscus]
MDSKLFYQLIKKQRGKLNRFIDELQVGESSLKGDNNILEGWKTHFANLAKESDPMNFDQDYFELVDYEYLQIIQICLAAYKHEEVTTAEFEKALHNLNRNKSADIFGITAECLLFRGEKLDSTLLQVINASFQPCYISNNLKTVKTNNKETFAEDTWSMNNKAMPIVTKTSHIGIQRNTTDSAGSTIKENLKKARRSLYSLMHTGLHGENGLDPLSAISMLQTFIFPIMFYGLEILLPTGKNLELISKQYKRIIKQIISLPVNVADPAIYVISGLLPAEAVIHKKALILFGSIWRAGYTSTEWKIAERQLGFKCIKSNSWFIAIKAIFLKYEIGAVCNKITPDGTCLMCKKNEETMNHFLLICEELQCIRKPLILEIISIGSMLFARQVDSTFDISTIIVNPYFYCTQLNSEALISDIDTKLEPLCRSLCYKLHARRYQLLDLTKKPRIIK